MKLKLNLFLNKLYNIKQTFITEEPKSENNSLREPENNFIEKLI